MNGAVWVREMVFDGELPGAPEIDCVPFSRERFEEYRAVYNACFHPMRRALEHRPYDWYSDYSQLAPRAEHIFLYIREGRIAGSVACLGGEIDDLIVAPSQRRKGYGRQLLLWAMRRIRDAGNREIVLRVAEWNRAAVKLYEDAGFVVRRRERIR